MRLWDHQPLLDTFGQIQELRTYYDFASVDNDRYTINGELRQVMLSARELNSESLPNRTWINEHLTFTHGYGITLGPVNEVTQEGLPMLFVKDIPPQSSVPGDIDVKEPSIYFGELTNNYVLVNTNAKEFHYSKGRRRERRDASTAAPTACASAGSAAGCSSASASSRCRFCSATTSPPTAACSTTGTSPTA